MSRDIHPFGAIRSAALPCLVLLAAALLTILPLLLHGPSCGHDQVFHLVSWFDAAAQLRHGHYPQWAIAPAWNAGEPRFLFYPPLSWLLGALLTLLLPPAAATFAYIALALAAAGLAMYRLAREFAAPPAALLAATFYLANPYMLFNAFERSAFAELLAAAWMPLLLLAVLRARPTVRSIAIPLALLWLTNAPAAVMGSYMLALLATLRVAHHLYQSRQTNSPLRPTLRLALTYIAGTVLGLALPAFYLLPAAIQRRFVQVDMAVIPNMRFQDNFLFDLTTDPGHNGVNHSISKLAVALLAATTLAIATLLLTRKPNPNPVLSTGTGRSHRPVEWRDLQPSPHPALPLTLLAATIAFLLFPLSTPIWQHLPEFAFLQFPWRLLTILTTVLALTLALLLDRIPALQPSASPIPRATPLLALLTPLALGFLLYAHTAQGCELRDRPASVASSLATHHGVMPTDEYTPTDADNDLLRTDDPGYWLAAHPTDPAPYTVPTPTELNPNANTDDIPIPFAETLSTHAPQRFTVDLTHAAFLILNLRSYPNWDIATCAPNTTTCTHSPHLRRDDGLIALELPPGQRTIQITWHRTLDQNLGLALTLLALTLLALLDLALAALKQRQDQTPPSA
jgi:hypothetical protein